MIAVAGWEVGVAAGSAILGALVGGVLSFTGVVYAARRQREAARRAELLDAMAAYAFATDLWAAHLEQLPPPDPESPFFAWSLKQFDRWLLGGERGAYLFGHLVRSKLFPSLDDDLRQLGRNYYEASGRLAFLAPPKLLVVLRAMTECLLSWEDRPGPEGLAKYGPIRKQLTSLGRELLAHDASH